MSIDDPVTTDPDLPGDETFVPTPPSVTFIINTPGGPAYADAMTVGAEAQASMHHNRLRYAELMKLRLGLANRYRETRYRR